eukprot:TRINITY_DN2204_c0_g1_i1.p1 TRINITY_DN2204_c0_g1~~TRINITY_DN2204_c0_g1_i1.p1  ORF type:complete len:243 (-),score=32.99 TRINITY_DN2204_c0_g1_i1:94-822(-)
MTTVDCGMQPIRPIPRQETIALVRKSSIDDLKSTRAKEGPTFTDPVRHWRRVSLVDPNDKPKDPIVQNDIIRPNVSTEEEENDLEEELANLYFRELSPNESERWLAGEKRARERPYCRIISIMAEEESNEAEDLEEEVPPEIIPRKNHIIIPPMSADDPTDPLNKRKMVHYIKGNSISLPTMALRPTAMFHSQGPDPTKSAHSIGDSKSSSAFRPIGSTQPLSRSMVELPGLLRKSRSVEED